LYNSHALTFCWQAHLNGEANPMSHTTVEVILGMIDSLPDSERELLHQRLAERLESEWRKEAENARRQAQARGIDQPVIDDAVHNLRYGR
jgi:hypothetical protein